MEERPTHAERVRRATLLVSAAVERITAAARAINLEDSRALGDLRPADATLHAAAEAFYGQDRLGGHNDRAVFFEAVQRWETAYLDAISRCKRDGVGIDLVALRRRRLAEVGS